MAEQGGRWLVFGASGYIGSHLVPRLLDESRPVRAAARNLPALEARGWEGAELMAADALDPQTLGPVLEGVDVAYYLVHSMTAGKGFGERDRQAARNFARAAAANGVRRILYLGGLVPEGARNEHIVSRRDTGEELRRGRVPVTEIRAGIIVGPGSAAFEVMRDLVLHLPVMPAPRWVRSRSPPIALDNLIIYLAVLPLVPEAAGRVYDAAGAETLSYEEMMREMAAAAGRPPPRIVPVPFLTPRVSSYFMHLVTTVPTGIARALVEGLRHDFRADDAELRRLVPQHLLGFREAVEAAFRAEREHRVVSRWTEGAFMIRQRRLDYAYYAKRASGSASTGAAPEDVWPVIESIGGANRYFAFDGLWTLREVLDWIAGGPGLNRRRRHPTELRVGDAVDSWKVIGLEPERRLTLQFGMKAPGAGVLELEVEPQGEGSRITATAYWHPAGVLGILYWYSLAPAHKMIFERMTSEIGRRAERRARRRTRVLPQPPQP